jgi:hypothetical protein
VNGSPKLHISNTSTSLLPHYCPCAWMETEDKVEFGEGVAMCGYKGGWKESELAKKVELARKGLS